MRNKSDRSLNVTAILVMFFFLACFTVACTSSRTVESGSPWTVTEITELGALTIKDGATLNAPDGYLLTMTVDGVETPIKAGAYKGKIVLTPTKKISKALYNGKTTNGENVDYRAGMFVDGGKIVEESSVLSALVGGAYDGRSASGMKITSNNSNFNGFIINDSNYTVSNVTMTATGAGGNDFTGYGAGIAITGASKVEIDNFNFTGGGPKRHGIYIGGEFEKDNLTVNVKNSFFKSDGSIGVTASDSGSSSVPLILEGIKVGRVRTQMIAGYANVTYKNSTLLSDGWGVLSTDDVSAPAKYGDYSVNLNVEDSIIDITGNGGYGTYSIGACHNVFSNTVMGNTEYSSNKYGMTWALVGANEYAGGEFLNGTKVTAKYGVMWHSNQTGVTKVDSSTFDTYGPIFVIKHCYPVINVSKSSLNSEAGVIVQLMSSDDPGMGAAYYAEVLDPASVARDKKHDLYHVNKTNTKIFNTELKDVVYDVQANFSEMDIKGDFYNSVSGVDDTELHVLGQNLVLSLDKVNLKGVISSAKLIRKKYSFYFSKEKDKDGNKIAVNADGFQIDGKWEARQSMFGGMPGGAGGAPGTAPAGVGAPQGAAGGMPGGVAGGADGAPGAAPQGAGAGMPGGAGGFPGGQPSKIFTPATDENGNYVVIGQKKYDLSEGVIVAKDAAYLGNYTNTPIPAVNNGVIVKLTNGSVWTVTGASYLTSLTIDNASIIAPEGSKVEMTVNGAGKEIKAGQTYTGNIVLSLSKISK